MVNPQSADERVQGVRQFIEMMGAEPRLTATALQTVGTKGWDGFTGVGKRLSSPGKRSATGDNQPYG